MLIINGGREAMPNSERRVLEALADPALPGVVVSGVYLADRRGRGRETDAVVLTPDAVAVLEVKGLTIDTPAGPVVLHTSANARWRAQGHDGDPVHVAPGDNSPFDQAAARVFDLKSALAGVPGEPPYVSGAVVVVGPAGARVQVAHSGPLPHGLAVLAVDRDGAGELRPWVSSLRRGRGRAPVFSAERAAAALAAIGVRAPSVAELGAAGFTSDPTGPAAAVAVAAVAGPPAPIGTPPAPAAAEPRRPRRPRPAAPRRRPPRPGRGAASGAGRALALGRAVVLAGVALAVLASVAAILLGQSTAGTTPGGAPGVFPAHASIEPATPTPEAPPAPPRACYPFQPC